MRVVFFGTGRFGLPTFDSIRGDRHEIVLVVTQPDRPRGRNMETSPTIIKQAAIEAGLPVISPEDVNAPEVVQQIRACQADLGYVAAFGQKIGTELRSAFSTGTVNLHGSLLPSWRGAAPVQWAVINGDAQSGVTVFRLVDRMDAGPILTQRRTAIGRDETADELHERLAHIGCDALRAAIEILSRDPKSPGELQDESAVTKARKLSKTDGLIRFDAPAEQLANKICGLWSWPGAVCRFVSTDGKRDERVTLARATRYDGPSEGTAGDPAGLGRISEMMSVRAADGDIMILEIKPAGGRLMTWQDYVNGRHVQPGDRFMQIEQDG